MRQWCMDGRRYFKATGVAEQILREQEGRRWHGNGVWSLPEGTRADRVAEEMGLPPLDPPPIPELELDSRLWDALLPFQKHGVKWLSGRSHALLWDEQGLGKTLQGLCWASLRAAETVIVAPLAVARQWCDAIEHWGLAERLVTYSSKGNPIELVVNGPGKGTWHVTTFERCAKLEPIKGADVIVDECTFVKNLKTKRTKNVIKHTDVAARVLLMSGHPMVNRPIDMWSVFYILRQRTQKEFWPWVNHYCGAYKTNYGWDFSGATHLDDLRGDLAGFGLRRTKAEVMPELPAKVWTILNMPREYELRFKEVTSAWQQVLEDAGRGISLEFGEGGAHMQHLRMECACSKVNFVDDWLDQHFEGDGGKVIVFSSFVPPLKGIESLRKDTVVITGEVSQKQRDEYIKTFWEDPDCKVLCMTYGVGALGLNLQCANTVLLMDRPHTPMELEQATDRAHRIGQKDSVLVVQVVGSLPIEHTMAQNLQYKLDVQEAVRSASKLKMSLY